MPPNHLRADWSDVDAWFARMGQATGGAVHHGASLPQMMVYDPALLRGLEHGEIARGYNALAYHTMWADDGDSAESRPYGAMGAATGGHNDHTIAFCAPGYFHPPHYHIPSDAMVRGMAAEFYWLRTNIDPHTGLTFMTWDAPIKPHAEWTAGTQWATACCGETFIARVAEIDELSRQPASAPTPVPSPARRSTVFYVTRPGPAGPATPQVFRVEGGLILDELPYGDSRSSEHGGVHWSAIATGLPILDGTRPAPFADVPLIDLLIANTLAAKGGAPASGGGTGPSPAAIAVAVRDEFTARPLR
jgi:hypothetical protein